MVAIFISLIITLRVSRMLPYAALLSAQHSSL